jgi:hypothetical protein
MFSIINEPAAKQHRHRKWASVVRWPTEVVPGKRSKQTIIVENDTQTDQEMMSQSDQQHMMMPAKPTAHFVMIETDFAFGFFKNDFNGPTHAADAHQLDQGCIGRGIAEAGLDH